MLLLLTENTGFEQKGIVSKKGNCCKKHIQEGDKKMKSKKTDLAIGVILIVVMLLNLLGFLRAIGITQRFVDLIVIATGAYLIIKGIR